MDYIIKEYKNINNEEWDDNIKSFPFHGFYHCSDWINYSLAFNDQLVNLSFILQNTAKKALAAVTLCLTIKENQNEFSFNGGFLSSILIGEMRPSERRTVLEDVLELIKTKAKEHQVKKIKMNFQTIHFSNHLTKSCFNFVNSFELQKYGFIFEVINTNIIDLSTDEETLLANMSKSQRKIIKRSFEKGINVLVIDEFSPDINQKFNNFQHAHFLSAGKLTRPQLTWNLMKSRITTGRAKLFISTHSDKELSYLYCGEHMDYVIGWSQVNIDQYEHEFSPRQSLEWFAISYYKRRGFNYYEIGETVGAATIFTNPTDKEKSIGHFKEKFGAAWYPRLRAIGYFDTDLLKKEIEENLNFLSTL